MKSRDITTPRIIMTSTDPKNITSDDPGKMQAWTSKTFERFKRFTQRSLDVTVIIIVIFVFLVFGNKHMQNINMMLGWPVSLFVQALLLIMIVWTMALSFVFTRYAYIQQKEGIIVLQTSSTVVQEEKKARLKVNIRRSIVSLFADFLIMAILIGFTIVFWNLDSVKIHLIDVFYTVNYVDKAKWLGILPACLVYVTINLVKLANAIVMSRQITADNERIVPRDLEKKDISKGEL